MSKEDKLDDLEQISRKDQYRELNENQRKLLELFWQEPSVIVAIASAVVVAAYYYITDAMCATSLQYQVLRTFLIMFGACMSWTSALTAIKHRFFRSVWLDMLEKMESKAGLKPVPMYTKNTTHPRGWNYLWEKWRAERMLIYSLVFLTIAFSLLGAVNLWNVLTRILPMDCLHFNICLLS